MMKPEDMLNKMLGDLKSFQAKQEAEFEEKLKQVPEKQAAILRSLMAEAKQAKTPTNVQAILNRLQQLHADTE